VLAALFTGSSAMWAEAFHAFADSGNQVLLLLAQRRSGRPPDEQHPLGHGRAAYFWALIAAMGVFAIGAVLSVHQESMGSFTDSRSCHSGSTYLVLFVSFCLDGVSLVQAQRQLRREAKALERTFLEHLDLSSDPVVRAVFAEDAAALVGNLNRRRGDRASPNHGVRNFRRNSCDHGWDSARLCRLPTRCAQW